MLSYQRKTHPVNNPEFDQTLPEFLYITIKFENMDYFLGQKLGHWVTSKEYFVYTLLVTILMWYSSNVARMSFTSLNNDNLD